MPHHFQYFLLAVFLVLPISHVTADDFDDFDFSPRTGLYVGGSILFQESYDIDSSPITGTAQNLEFSLDDSTSYSLVTGAYLNQFRIEFEANYFETDYTDIRFLNFPINIDGDLSYLSFLGNLYYDIPLGSDQLNLYVGAGAGFSIVSSDAALDVGLINSTTVGGITTTTAVQEIDDTFTTFTYQFLAGLSYEVVDNVTLTGGYRLRGFGERSNSNDLSGITFQEHFVQSFEVGIRFDF